MKELLVIEKLLTRLRSRGYLVGGAVRDWLLGGETADFDLIITAQVEKIARQFAEQTESSFVVLDEDRSIYRVVSREVNYDFSLLKEETLTEDLLNRDFTFNALALPLTESVVKGLQADLAKEKLIDPLGGGEDLNQKIIRVVAEDSFLDDPLRLLRAVRFKAQLGFEVSSKTERLMQQAAGKINRIAEERIKEELIKILKQSGAARNIAYLEEKFNLLSSLISEINDLKNIGQCKYHQEDVWTHSVYAVEKVEQLMNNQFWNRRIKAKNRPLLKLAILFHDLGKMLTEEVVDGEVHFYDHQKEGASYLVSIFERLAFSRREIDYIKRLVRYHMRPLQLYSAENLTFKGKYRFFRAAKDWTSDVCLAAAADMLSTVELNSGASTDDSLHFLRKLVVEKEEQDKKTEPRLVSGTDIMEIFSLEEGPLIGKLLTQVKKAQAEGQISTREEAIDYLQELIDN